MKLGFYVSVIKICSPQSWEQVILVPLRRNGEREIRSGRKGRREWSICRQWGFFAAYPVYHMSLELILWCHAQWEFWQGETITYSAYKWMWLLQRELKVSLQVLVHMCRLTTECPHTSSLRLTWSVMLDTTPSSLVLVRYFPAVFMLCLAHESLESVSETWKAAKKERKKKVNTYFIFSSLLLTYEWHAIVKRRSCHHWTEHKHRKARTKALQVQDKIMETCLGPERSLQLTPFDTHEWCELKLNKWVTKWGSNTVNSHWQM